MTATHLPRLLMLITLPLWLAGCVGGTSPATRFYSLEPVASEVAGAIAADTSLSIGLGPVVLPERLNRAQIVVREDAHRLVLAEFDQWATGLQEDFARALALRLMSRLPSAQISLAPWPRHRNLDRQVRIDVLRFDGQAGGESQLSGAWTLLDGEGRAELKSARFDLRDQPSGTGIEALVASFARLNARLADDIALVLSGDR